MQSEATCRRHMTEQLSTTTAGASCKSGLITLTGSVTRNHDSGRRPRRYFYRPLSTSISSQPPSSPSPVDPQKNRDLIEVIQQILARGFKGRYRFAADGEQQINAVCSDIRDAIAAGSPSLPIAQDSARANDCYPPLQRLLTDLQTVRPDPKSRRWPTIVVVCLALLAIAAGGVYWHFVRVSPPA